MKVYTVGPAEDRWSWYTVPNGDGAEVELYMPDMDELDRYRKKYARKEGREDVRGMRRHIAQYWFREFRKMEKTNGEPIPNDLEHRVLILQATPIWRFVNDLFLGEAYEQEEVGKDETPGSSAGRRLYSETAT